MLNKEMEPLCCPVQTTDWTCLESFFDIGIDILLTGIDILLNGIDHC